MKFVLDERVKHRLMGLVVIIAIAIIFLPAVMKKSNQRFEENVRVSVNLPAKPPLPKVAVSEEKKLFQEVKVAHVDLRSVEPVAPNQQVKAEPLTMKSNVVSAAVSTNKKLLEAKRESTARAKVQTLAVVKKLAPMSSPKKGVYAVQIASFSQQSNAQTLVNQLRKQGFHASYNKITANKSEQYKVIVGELKQIEEAVNLQKQIQAKTQLHGFIIKTGVS